MSVLTALRTSISKLAAVQQDDMAASIKAIADKVAANSSYDASADLASFAQVRPLYCMSQEQRQVLLGHVKVQRRMLQFFTLSSAQVGSVFSAVHSRPCMQSGWSEVSNFSAGFSGQDQHSRVHDQDNGTAPA